MAATIAGERVGGVIRNLVLGLLLRTGGAVLLGLAGFLALALVGHDPADPSFSTASDRPVRNPAGLAGAVLADLVFQLFGLSAWLLVAVSLSWGLRLVLRRPLRWPWLPVAFLPLALLSTSAFFALLPQPAPASWPFRVGLGGLVGDFLWSRIQTRLAFETWYLGTLVAALVSSVLALGLRWGESLWALGRIAAGSLWLGRRVSAAAVRAGRLSQEAWRGARSSVAPPVHPVAPPAAAERGEEGEPSPARRRRNLWRRVGRPLEAVARWLDPEEEDVATAGRRPGQLSLRPAVEEEAVSAPPTPAGERRQPRSRNRPSRVPEPQAVAAAAEGERPFALPSPELLAEARRDSRHAQSRGALEEMARRLEGVLEDFGVRGEIVDIRPGPVVTLFELEPAPGTRSQRVINLADDIARSLSQTSVRIATVPGRNVIGIELPNLKREIVYLRELIESEAFRSTEARLPLALGKDIAGEPYVVDLARMPHLLIAGTTGSGKSVAINAMILSLLYRLTPDQCRLLMIDPKVIELSVYEDIPHLLCPVVTEPQKAVVALKWVVRQMDERYRLMSYLGVRDIFSFNRRVAQARARGERLERRVRVGFEPGTGAPIMENQPIDTTPLPLIVVIVDEVADLMMTAGREIEHAIQRLSQKARAAGIHLIVATQRPSVDVLTGVIKANLPSRISFRVSSKIDSRTILGESGAEQLLGQGDMLYLMPGDRITRIHGPLVTDQEVEAVVEHLRRQGEPNYLEEITRGDDNEAESPGPWPAGEGGGEDLYARAVQIVIRDGKASTSYLQRRLSIGYNSAARLIERMEAEGIVSAADHVGRRQVLAGRGGVDGTEPMDHL